MKYRDEFDYIVSFSTLHWIQNQKLLLSNIFNALKINGKFFFIIPTRTQLTIGANIFADSLKFTSKQAKWKKYLDGFKPNYILFSSENYKESLVREGFKVQSINVKIVNSTLQNIEEFKNWMKQFLPHLEKIPEKFHSQFLEDIANKYVSTFPLDKDGHVVLNRAIIVVSGEKQSSENIHKK